jgi:putative tricarboxylic transport membrane protein
MKEQKQTTIGDAIIGLAIIAFCAYFWMETAELPAAMGNIPGPALFPRLVLVGLLITGVWLVVRNLRFRPATASRPRADRGALLAVAGMLTAIAVYALVLQAIPFLIATPVFIIVGSLIALRFRCTRNQIVVLGAMSIFGSLLIQIVFIHGLGIRL